MTDKPNDPTVGEVPWWDGLPAPDSTQITVQPCHYSTNDFDRCTVHGGRIGPARDKCDRAGAERQMHDHSMLTRGQLAAHSAEYHSALRAAAVDVAVQQERIRVGSVRGHSDEDEFCHCPDCLSYMAEDDQ